MSDFLFSTPNFLVGAGSVINIAGNYYSFNESDSESEADEKAIKNDFEMVGQDIYNVINDSKSRNSELILAE
ncbi:MAG: hypothetical protein EHM93_04335 [Bacteroidales bacterium]|nr:MAG: hypothetical protein EHM93_04335 [Bacteroidales bacterium]